MQRSFSAGRHVTRLGGSATFSSMGQRRQRLGWLLLLCAATGAAERCVAIRRSGGGDGAGTKSEEGIALCEQDPARQQSAQACKAGAPVDNIDPAIECEWETEDLVGLYVGIGLGALFAVGISSKVYLQYVKHKRASKGMVSSPTPPVGAPPVQVAQAVEMPGAGHGVPAAQAEVVGVVVGTPT